MCSLLVDKNVDVVPATEVLALLGVLFHAANKAVRVVGLVAAALGVVPGDALLGHAVTAYLHVLVDCRVTARRCRGNSTGMSLQELHLQLDIEIILCFCCKMSFQQKLRLRLITHTLYRGLGAKLL